MHRGEDRRPDAVLAPDGLSRPSQAGRLGLRRRSARIARFIDLCSLLRNSTPGVENPVWPAPEPVGAPARGVSAAEGPNRGVSRGSRVVLGFRTGGMHTSSAPSPRAASSDPRLRVTGAHLVPRQCSQRAPVFVLAAVSSWGSLPQAPEPQGRSRAGSSRQGTARALAQSGRRHRRHQAAAAINSSQASGCSHIRRQKWRETMGFEGPCTSRCPTRGLVAPVGRHLVDLRKPCVSRAVVREATSPAVRRRCEGRDRRCGGCGAGMRWPRRFRP